MTAAERARLARADILDPGATVARADRQAEPIFASMQSEWFRQRAARPLGPPTGGVRMPSPSTPTTGQQVPVPAAVHVGSEANITAAYGEEPEAMWASPGDDGWQAASALVSPSVGGYTHAGLPRRVPKTNLVPGTAGAVGGFDGAGRHAAPTADEVRGRLTSFHRGTRRGREESHDEDDSLPTGYPSGGATGNEQ